MSSAVSSLLGGRYALDARIGAGGFSEVWRAHDAVLDRQVAIKLLDPRYASDPEGLARFRTEAKNAGCLSHENIARVYDFGEPEPPSPPYLVMELVDGPSLAEVLAAGPLSLAKCLDVVAQAAAGLHAAHLAGLVHRDIKPGNLLLGPGGIVKLADFGISHAITSAPVTCTGIVIGSPGYVAPERAAGARATMAGDLYSLGAVAYECLAGAPPFEGSGLDVALAHLNLPFPALPPDVPADVAALVGQLTAKDPAARPDDARAVARRAGRLRDAIRTGAAGIADDTADPAPPGPAPAPVSAGLRRLRQDKAGRWPARPSDGRLPGPGPAGRWPEQPSESRWRGPALAARRLSPAGVAVLGGLATVMIVVLWAASPGAPSRLAPQGLRPAAATLTATVDVNGRALVGQPVAVAVRRLRQLGLRVRVVWRPTASQPAGLVVAVRPGGSRPVGSLVTVVGARHPAARSYPVHHGHARAAGQPGAAGHAAGHPPGKAKGRGKDKGHGKDKGTAKKPGK